MEKSGWVVNVNIRQTLRKFGIAGSAAVSAALLVTVFSAAPVSAGTAPSQPDPAGCTSGPTGDGGVQALCKTNVYQLSVTCPSLANSKKVPIDQFIPASHNHAGGGDLYVNRGDNQHYDSVICYAGDVQEFHIEPR